jgi:hypothetical protein
LLRRGIFFKALQLEHFLLTLDGHLILGDYSNACLLPSFTSSSSSSAKLPTSESINNNSAEGAPSSTTTSSKKPSHHLTSGSYPAEVLLGGVPNQASNTFIAGALIHQILTLGKPVAKIGAYEEKHLSYLYRVLGTPHAMGWNMSHFDALPYAQQYQRRILSDAPDDKHPAPHYTESKCRIHKSLRASIPSYLLTALSPMSAQSSQTQVTRDDKATRKKPHRHGEDKDTTLPPEGESDQGHVLDMMYRALHVVPQRRATIPMILEMPFFADKAYPRLSLDREIFVPKEKIPSPPCMVITPSPPPEVMEIEDRPEHESRPVPEAAARMRVVYQAPMLTLHQQTVTTMNESPRKPNSVENTAATAAITMTESNTGSGHMELKPSFVPRSVSLKPKNPDEPVVGAKRHFQKALNSALSESRAPSGHSKHSPSNPDKRFRHDHEDDSPRNHRPSSSSSHHHHKQVKKQSWNKCHQAGNARVGIGHLY